MRRLFNNKILKILTYKTELCMFSKKKKKRICVRKKSVIAIFRIWCLIVFIPLEY